MERPVAAKFWCALCGAVAATVTLLPPDPAAGSEFERAWRLTVEGGPVPMTVGPVRDVNRVIEGLRWQDSAVLAGVDAEYANFRCPACGENYCRDHWVDVIPEIDEGFYDATFGTCPRGHRVMLDD